MKYRLLDTHHFDTRIKPISCIRLSVFRVEDDLYFKPRSKIDEKAQALKTLVYRFIQIITNMSTYLFVTTTINISAAQKH